MANRQIVLDTETTGLETSQGHRIIEIGAIELIDRKVTGNHFHYYLQPDRAIDPGAMQVHGITNEFLIDKPRFADIQKAFLEYVGNAGLIIHNAAFDIGFIDHEMRMIDRAWSGITSRCDVTDTLELARKLHPGQKNSLDALCKRYGIDNSKRDLHGALLDSQLLAEVYLAMTGGQVSLMLGTSGDSGNVNEFNTQGAEIRRVPADRPRLSVLYASEEETQSHEQRLNAIEKASGGTSVWRAFAEKLT